MALTATQRATLQNLLNMQARQLPAIDSIFSVTGDGTGGMAYAERQKMALFLRAVSNDPAALDTLFNITGLANEQANLVLLRAALEGDPTSLDTLVNGIGYDWTIDTQVIGRWKAGSFADLAPSGPFGALVASGGTPATVATVIDGQSVWRFTKGAGVALNTTNRPQYCGPFHIIIVARATSNGGAPASTDVWIGDGGSSTFGTRISYTDANNLVTLSGAGNAIPCTTANFNCINVYSHGANVRYSVNGAAYSAPGAGTATVINGISIGDFHDHDFGTFSSGIDVAEVIIVEGQMSSALSNAIHAYLRSTYPSLGVAATAPVGFSVDQTSLGGIVTAPFDFILVGGQSNNGNNTSAATAAPAANTFMFTRANAFAALTVTYDRGPAVDIVDTAGLLNGGNATALANAYVASTGRPLVIVPCASGGSAMNESTGFQPNVWNPLFPRSHKFRNSPYGSMLARAKNMIALGGVFRFLWWYQGETEASLGGPNPAAHAALTDAMLNSFFIDFNQPQRVVIQPLANTLAGATAPNLATVQAGQASLASPNRRLIGAPWGGAMEADNIHVAAAGQNAIGAAAAALALAQPAASGWY